MPDCPHFLLNADDPAALTAWLRAHHWIGSEDVVDRLDSAGEGNMNLTLRAHVGDHTLIVKQSRPWVEKYPDIAAPQDRVLVEAAFYAAVAEFEPVAARMPRLLGVDAADRVMALEDLGRASDCVNVYVGVYISDADLADLLAWLSALHAAPIAPTELLRNRAMRALNHEHIFDLPLRTGALDADAFLSGLEARAATLRADGDYVAAVHRLGERYLADGDTLLHGDFYPGSWLKTAGGMRVIDPEFGFLGPPEFDVGVALGHLVLAGGRLGRLLTDFRAAYAAPSGFDWELAQAFAGVELMRRLIGVAQLPTDADLARRGELLELSRELVR